MRQCVDELRRLSVACQGKEFADRRDEAMIRLFVDTGMRVAEMCGITLVDLDMRTDQVTVLGKGDRVRILPFGAKIGTSLERYLRLRTKHKLLSKPYLSIVSTSQTPSGWSVAIERPLETLRRIRRHLRREI
jgi:site-specific recombinase XerC